MNAQGAFESEVVVENNDVIGYGRALEAAGESERAPEGTTQAPAAVVVDASASISEMSVSGNQVTAPEAGGRVGIVIDHDSEGGTTNVVDNDVDGYSTGIDLGLSHVDATVSVEGNTVQGRNSTADGLIVSVYAARSVQANVEGNEVDDSGEDGIEVSVSGAVGDGQEAEVRLVDNDVEDSGFAGLRLLNYVNDLLDAVIGGNTVDATGQVGINIQDNSTSGQIDVTSDVDGTIEDNGVTDSGVADLDTSGNVTGTIRVNGVDETLPLP